MNYNTDYILLHIPNKAGQIKINEILHQRKYVWKGTGEALDEAPMFDPSCRHPDASKEFFALSLKDKTIATVMITGPQPFNNYYIVEIRS